MIAYGFLLPYLRGSLEERPGRGNDMVEECLAHRGTQEMLVEKGCGLTERNLHVSSGLFTFGEVAVVTLTTQDCMH